MWRWICLSNIEINFFIKLKEHQLYIPSMILYKLLLFFFIRYCFCAKTIHTHAKEISSTFHAHGCFCTTYFLCSNVSNFKHTIPQYSTWCCILNMYLVNESNLNFEELSPIHPPKDMNIRLNFKKPNSNFVCLSGFDSRWQTSIHSSISLIKVHRAIILGREVTSKIVWS